MERVSHSIGERTDMRRIRLRVAYDGTAYCGWQVQPEVPTIEGELNQAISRLTKEEIIVIGASRTESMRRETLLYLTQSLQSRQTDLLMH